MNYKKCYKIAREAGKENKIFHSYKNVLESSFIFQIPNALSLLLSLTDSDFDIDNLRLPYANCFLDCKFMWEDYNIFGLCLSQLQLEQDTLPQIYLSYLFCKEDNESKEVKITLKRFDELDNKNLPFYKVNQKIKLLVINFLDFLNNPELEFVDRKINRNKLGTFERKFSRGSSIIVLNGKLKKYVDDIDYILKSRGRIYLRSRYWVRGHWRRFKSNKYVNMKGKKTWIYPFIKGMHMKNIQEHRYLINV